MPSGQSPSPTARPSARAPSCWRRSPPAMQLLRVRQRHAFEPVVIAYRAAVGARAKGQRRLLASHLLRARQSHACVPDEVFLQCCRQRGKEGGPQHQQASHPSRSSQAVAKDGHFNSEATLSTGIFVQIADSQASRRKSPIGAGGHGPGSEHEDNVSGRFGGVTPSTGTFAQSDSSASV